MPAGQSHSTWFPELKATLKSQWQFDSNIEDHFALINKLNNQLTNIRKELNVKAPMFYCYHGKEKHASEFTMVTIANKRLKIEIN